MFMLINTTTRRDKVGPWSPVVGESVPIHKPEKKGKQLFGNDPTVFQTCVLGLLGQVNKFDSNRLLPIVWDCLISLPHRVIRTILL